MKRQLSVAVIEPQSVLRELISQSIRSVPEIEFAWAAQGAKEARDKFDEQPVDVLISELDLVDGNGVGLAISLRTKHPQLGIILITDSFDAEDISAIPETARSGWRVIRREEITGISAFVSEIHAAAAGLGRLPLNVMDYQVDPAVDDLTPRQLQVLQALAEGLANPTIAEKLGIEVSSVVNHLTAIYATLGVPVWANPRVYSTLTFLGQRPEARK